MVFVIRRAGRRTGVIICESYLPARGSSSLSLLAVSESSGALAPSLKGLNLICVKYYYVYCFIYVFTFYLLLYMNLIVLFLSLIYVKYYCCISTNIAYILLSVFSPF